MKARTRSFIVTALASATVLFAAGCGTQETIFSSQLETIRTWITSQSDNNGPDYEEVASGVYRAIILPDGTNQALDENHYAGGEDRLLTAKNKWLIGHPEGGLPEGTHLGLKGANLCVKELER